MAITESTIINEITVLPLESTIQVKWRNTVERDGEVLLSKDHYKLYTAEQSNEFLAEVEGAAAYIQAAGWNS